MRPLGLALTLLLCAIASMACIPRTGFVSLQLCDSHESHYSVLFPLLEAYGYKGSFSCITEISDLGIEHEAYKMQEIYQAGHEIMDHTTRHDYMWATHVDTLDDGAEDWIPYTFADMATWDSLCNRSLFILDSLGIEVTGWSQPGGSVGLGMIPGHPDWLWRGAYNESLYALIGSKYIYAVGANVSCNTAHLNLRGHNCPDRFPFFNLPHITIDYRAASDVRTGVADAVAAGLWYPAVSHGNSPTQLARVESLVVWMHEHDIEVLRCADGVDRLLNGDPDPYANQLPQAEMLCDRDGNGKPDGFTGCCTWDTTSAVPVQGCNAMGVYGDAEFFCYGPEVGRSSFSVWMKAADGMSGTVRLIWVKLSFDGVYMEDCYNPVVPGEDWVLVDSTTCSGLALDVEDEVDRLLFVVRPTTGVRVRVCHPSLLLAADADVPAEDVGITMNSALTVAPNPVRSGEPARILGSCCTTVYDVLGRRIRVVHSPIGAQEVVLRTGSFAPGVYMVHDRDGERAPAKIVISR